MLIDKYYAGVDGNGIIQQTKKVSEDDSGPNVPPVGPYTFYLLDGPLDWVMPSPTSQHRWIDGAAAWVETATLDEAKAMAWDRIKAARDVAEAADFTCAGYAYQSDKARISGAALAALMAQVASQPYTIDWTISDNSVVTLDGPQMMAVGVALMQHIDGVFEIARGLRVQIEAATTIAEAVAVNWP